MRKEIEQTLRDPVGFFTGGATVVSVFFWIIFFLGETGLISFGHLWQYFALPASLPVFVRQPWSLITYPFIHLNIIDFFINLLLVHFIGTRLQTYEPDKRLFRLAFGGMTAGALALWGVYYFIPAWFADELNTYLTGMSVVFAAWLGYAGIRYGDYPLYMRLFGRWKWRWLLILFLIWDLVQLPLKNTGGHAAHLGAFAAGMLWAYALVRRPLNKSSKDFKVYDNYKTRSEKQIDRILDKINRSGLDSLTEEEKEILYRESQRNNRL